MQIQNMVSFNPQGMTQGSQATAFTDDQRVVQLAKLLYHDRVKNYLVVL